MLRKMSTLLILLVLIPVFSFASSESESLVNYGRKDLFNAGMPTYQGIVDADEKFALAVQEDEFDQKARLFRAITRVGAFVLKTGDGGDLSTIADIIQAMGIPISLDAKIGSALPFGNPPELAGNLNLPETTPNGDDVRRVLGSGLVGVIDQSLADLGLIDVIDQSLADLGRIDDTIHVVLTGDETGDFADTEVDYTDVLLARAGLTAFKTILLIITAYDFDQADIRELAALANSGMMDFQRGLMSDLFAKDPAPGAKYSNLLRLAPEGDGEAFLAAAKTALQSVHDLLVLAHVFLLSEFDDPNDNQDDDLFTYESEADDQEFENILSGLGELMDSLEENRSATIKTLEFPWVVTLESGETLNFYLVADQLGNGSMIRNDSSFSGQIDSFDIYGGRVSYWKITQTDATRNIRIILDYWGYKRLELNGVLDLNDTLLAGTCSFQTNEGSGYEEKETRSFTASQTGSIEEDVEQFDLNALFGNPNYSPVKFPLVIREFLPEFDVFGEPLEGTFPEPVFNGLFPDFDSAGLSEKLELELPYQTFVIPEETVDIESHPGTWPDVTHVTEDLHNDGYMPDGMDIKDIYIAKDATYLYMGMGLGGAPLQGDWDGAYIAYQMDFRKDRDDWYRNAVSFWAEYANHESESKWHVNITNRNANGEESALGPYKDGYVHAGSNFIAWKLPLVDFDPLGKFGGWDITSETRSNIGYGGDWVDRTTKLEPGYTIQGSVAVPDGYTGGKVYLYLSNSEYDFGDAILGSYIKDLGIDNSFVLNDAPYSSEPLYLHVFWDRDGNGIPNFGDYTAMTSFKIENNVTTSVELKNRIPLIEAVSVKSVHFGDNQFKTFFEVEIVQAFAGDMPGEIDTITIKAPDGNTFQMYPGNDSDWDAKWNEFFLEVPGTPQKGAYDFTVTTKNGDIYTKIDTQKDLISIPIVDVSTVKIDTGSKTPVFSWEGVSAPGTGIAYRLEIRDMGENLVFWTGRDWNMTACAVPESKLQPGTQYQYRIRAMDDSNWIQIDNRSHTEWTPFTMDNFLGHSSVPAIDLDGYGATLWSHTGSTPGGDAWIKVIDHDGVAYNGSSHGVFATLIDAAGNFLSPWYPMVFQYAENGTTGYYSAWIDSNALPSETGGVMFYVADPDGLNGTIADVLTDLNMMDRSDIELTHTPSGTTPRFTWNSVQGANKYRLRIYNEAGNRTIWKGNSPKATSYTVPPGVLSPGTTYQYRLDARNAHDGFDIDQVIAFPARDASGNYPVFTTGELTDSPYIETNWAGVETWTDDYRGMHTSFWIRVYDAQGVPNNIQSVTVTDINGKITQLYYEYNESENCAIYSNDSYEAPQNGAYSFIVTDKEENTFSIDEELTVAAIGFPPESSLTVSITGTGGSFDWADVDGAAVYRLEIYNKNHQRILKFATTESEYELAPGFLEQGEVYGFRVTTRREFWDENTDNGSSSPWSPYRAINFKTEPVMDSGTNLPEIDTGNFGVAVTYLKHPVTGAPSYWLQFSVKVTDPDGVPENIKSVIVEGPGSFGSLTLNYDSKREGNTAEYWNDITYDSYDDIIEGVYTFTVVDEDGNGNRATTSDTLVKKEVPLVEYLTPVDGAKISSDRPVIDWDEPAGGPYFYKVKIYTHWNSLVHQSGILENSSYIVPGGILQPGEVYGYRLYAYDKDINTDDVDNVSINNVFFTKQNHFTISDGPSTSILTEFFKLINVMIGNPADISSFATDINQDNKLDMKDAIPVLQEAGALR